MLALPINRREWLAGVGLATLTACSRRKGSGFNGYALVANAGDNSLAAVDLTEFRLANSMPLRAEPSRTLAAPSGHQVLVLTPADGSVHIVDSQLKGIKSQRLADFVADMAITPDGKSLIALAPHSRELIQANLETLRPIARHKLSVTADSLDLSSTGYAAVSSHSGEVELLHLVTGQRAQTRTAALGFIRFRADGKILLAANIQNRSLLALDVPTLRVWAELPLAMRPDNLCFNSDQGQLFVSGAGMDGVAVVFPYNTLEVDQTLLAGKTPGAMACSATPRFLFVASTTASDVCILNIDTRKVIGLVEIGGRPSLIKVTPDSQYALVFDQGAGEMGVIHIPAIRESGDARRFRNGAALFTMLSVGSKPVDAAIISKPA